MGRRRPSRGRRNPKQGSAESPARVGGVVVAVVVVVVVVVIVIVILTVQVMVVALASQLPITPTRAVTMELQRRPQSAYT